MTTSRAAPVQWLVPRASVIRERRKERGLSQAKLKDLAGLGLCTIEGLERAPKSVKPETAAVVATVLDATVEALRAARRDLNSGSRQTRRPLGEVAEGRLAGRGGQRAELRAGSGPGRLRDPVGIPPRSTGSASRAEQRSTPALTRGPAASTSATSGSGVGARQDRPRVPRSIAASTTIRRPASAKASPSSCSRP